MKLTELQRKVLEKIHSKAGVIAWSELTGPEKVSIRSLEKKGVCRIITERRGVYRKDAIMELEVPVEIQLTENQGVKVEDTFHCKDLEQLDLVVAAFNQHMGILKELPGTRDIAIILTYKYDKKAEC